MSDLGIYFGPKAIDVSEVKGRKLINSVQLPLLGIAGNELDEKVPTEIKLVASFNDAFRRNKIEAKETVLCLSGKDLIIRTFEIPVLPKDEMHGAINFEAKKYIPFKVEELISDYQVEFDKASRTNVVLFMGIKKDTYDKYFSILNQLNIKINSIEYSGFSALRVLKLAGIRESGVMSILSFDYQSQDEINFTVLENGFPLFSRDISLSSGPSDLDPIADSAVLLSLDKLKAEIRVSLDYYHRKFPAKPLKNFFILANPDWRQELDAFIGELGLPSKFIDIGRIAGKPMMFSSGFVKSYSVAIYKTISTKVKINLIESKFRAGKVGGGGAVAVFTSLFKKVKIDFRFLIMGVLICAAAFMYGSYRLAPLKLNLDSIINQRIPVGNIDPDSSYEALNIISSKDRKTLNNLDNLIKKQLYITEVLDFIPRVLPDGVWLNKFSLNKRDTGVELELEGMSYLGNSNDEFQSVNKFLSSLKENNEFAKYFKDISVVSIDHTQFLEATVTTFLISCKSYKEGK
jgi:hypothetical protein